MKISCERLGLKKRTVIATVFLSVSFILILMVKLEAEKYYLYGFLACYERCPCATFVELYAEECFNTSNASIIRNYGVEELRYFYNKSPACFRIKYKDLNVSVPF